MSTLQKNVLKMPSKPEVSWCARAHSGNTLLILRLFISYFPFRESDFWTLLSIFFIDCFVLILLLFEKDLMLAET